MKHSGDVCRETTEHNGLWMLFHGKSRHLNGTVGCGLKQEEGPGYIEDSEGVEFNSRLNVSDNFMGEGHQDFSCHGPDQAVIRLLGQAYGPA